MSVTLVMINNFCLGKFVRKVRKHISFRKSASRNGLIVSPCRVISGIKETAVAGSS